MHLTTTNRFFCRLQCTHVEVTEVEVEDPDAAGIENFAPAGTPVVQEQHVCDARNLVDFVVVNPHTYYI